MANKNLIQRKDILVKWVRVANMWCKTWWNNKGEQKQEWSTTEPNTVRPNK